MISTHSCLCKKILQELLLAFHHYVLLYLASSIFTFTSSFIHPTAVHSIHFTLVLIFSHTLNYWSVSEYWVRQKVRMRWENVRKPMSVWKYKYLYALYIFFKYKIKIYVLMYCFAGIWVLNFSLVYNCKVYCALWWGGDAAVRDLKCTHILLNKDRTSTTFCIILCYFFLKNQTNKQSNQNVLIVIN